MYRIYLVEDDPVIAAAIQEHLSAWGFTVQRAENFSDILGEFAAFQPHLVLLDITLPFFNGYHWCQEIRRVSQVPILFLSSASENMNIVMAIHMGADDFIPKPFDNLEVLARVEAQLRRVKKFSAPPAQKQQLSCGDLVLDRDELTVTAGGSPVTLTAREFEILALLMEYPKKVFTREQIYQHVWGEDYFGDDNTVNVHISNLRSKLGKASDREYIKTVWGIGFKMAEV